MSRRSVPLLLACFTMAACTGTLGNAPNTAGDERRGDAGGDPDGDPAGDASTGDAAGCTPTTEICGDGIDQDCNGADLSCPACGEGAITARCECGGVAGAAGYCCSGSLQSTACSPNPINELVDPARITTWDPGIRSDEQLQLPLGANGLPQRDTLCATLNPGDDVQAAIDACPEGQVVLLNPGTFTVTNTVTLTKGVVVRGSGSEGAPTGTTVAKTGGESVFAIGTSRDSICYGGTGSALTADGQKGATTVDVGAASSAFQPGDLALIDVVDDSTVLQGDCPYFKRESGRSASQRVEIAAVNGSSLTLSSPLHWDFPAGAPYLGEVTRVSQAVVRWAGIEHLRLRDGSNPGYNGQMAGGIDISNAAHCWVEDVQTDDTIGGMHISMTGTYGCVVRDSYLHHSANYGFGADCYGIVLRCGAADNLIENNIVRYMNKPILFNVTGGGNVVAYNYADNSWSDTGSWQEVNIDCHCSFPHMELMEGNYAPHVGATVTHGNAGYLTFFRNYASSQFAPPVTSQWDGEQTGNVAAIQLQTGVIGNNAIGNVLGTAGVSTTYEAYDTGSRAIYQLGDGGAGASDIAATSLYRHGNYDTVTGSVLWSPTSTAHDLPPSLYLSGRPAWWPAGRDWPWAGPDLTPRVGVLPAKERSDNLP